MLNDLPGHESLGCLKTKQKEKRSRLLFKESLQYKIERENSEEAEVM